MREIVQETHTFSPFLSFFFFFFFFWGRGHTWVMRKFPGQESNPHRSSNPSCYSDNARSLTHCPTWELPRTFFFLNLFYWNTLHLQHCVNLCCTAKWFSYTHTYIFLFHILSIMVYYRVLSIISALDTRTLLCIHSICNNSLCLLTPNSQCIPPSPHLPLGNHTSLLYVCESV